MNLSSTFPEPLCRHLAPSEERDKSFTGRMRFHQSWYRHAILQLKPGPNPHAHGDELYGNMLIEEDAREGKNFLTPQIFEFAKERFPLSQKDNETARLYQNLLSSQPMCFNLFGPLKSSPELATVLLRLLPGFPQDAQVTNLFFEYPPKQARPLADQTSFDACISYERRGRVKGFIGIETKLTEPFSLKKYAFSQRYRQWMDRGDLWWRPNAENRFSSFAFNQLWRNHLLTYSMLNQPDPLFREGYCCVVFHPGNKHCSNAMQEYHNLLTPMGTQTLLSWPIDRIAELWVPHLKSQDQIDWFDDFQTRYLRLETSEQTWHLYTRD